MIQCGILKCNGKVILYQRGILVSNELIFYIFKNKFNYSIYSFIVLFLYSRTRNITYRGLEIIY
jgi:hypothetical protein